MDHDDDDEVTSVHKTMHSKMIESPVMGPCTHLEPGN